MSVVSVSNIKGDAVKLLKEGKLDFLMHCCNPYGVMGAGIAKQIAHEFPEALRVYQFACKNSQSVVGTYTQASGVVNLVGQVSLGEKRDVHYGAIARAMSDFAFDYLVNKNDGAINIGLPKFMGCALAGGSWEVIHELLLGIFSNPKLKRNFYVYIVELDK